MVAADTQSWDSAKVYTVGHSTRSEAELIELLKAHAVRILIDVRTIPRSRRNPQFNTDAMAAWLPERGIRYVHLPKLGGRRRGLGETSLNTGWRNESFRGYADYMQTDEFAAGIEELRALISDGPVALMCAEAMPWRCHRSLIADALLVRGVQSEDIQAVDRTLPDRLTPFAQVDGEQITYPGERRSLNLPR
jgi:uncharacterized protein (DUF488 family)